MAEAGRPVPELALRRGAARARLAEILRVDRPPCTSTRGQQAVFSAAAGKTALGETFADLKAQEAEHLAAFDALLAENGVRPSLLTPLWRAAAFASAPAPRCSATRRRTPAPTRSRR